MQIEVIIAVASVFASLLTFISGFGLGTLLLPVFSLFFDIEVAITATAIVHLFNNIFKSFLTFKQINWEVVLKFGLPSVGGAIIGSILLNYIVLKSTNSISFQLGSNSFETSLLKLIIGGLILLFTLFEVFNLKSKVLNHKNSIYVGGGLSGFFGGVSGHQGALRTLFLSKFKLDKYSFIASGICIALAVDLSRIPIYINEGYFDLDEHLTKALVIAIFCAFLGAIAGKTLLNKIKVKVLYNIHSLFLDDVCYSIDDRLDIIYTMDNLPCFISFITKELCTVAIFWTFASFCVIKRGRH